MKKLIYIFSSIIISAHMQTYTAENQLQITYHKAAIADALHITKIINESAYKDKKRIVIVPKKFRASAIESAITDNKLYVAKNPKNEIVAFKKLFIIHLEQNFDDITQNELRCFGSQKRFVDARIVSISNPQPIVVSEEFVRPLSFHDNTIIYFGGDYTVPEYRNKKINSQLTRSAFNFIKDDVLASVRVKNAQNLILLYGLTRANAGEGSGEIDRSPSIIRAFIPFAESVAQKCGSKQRDAASHSRYHSFMPTFNPDSPICKPLPDRYSIAGYGNVVIFPLVTKSISPVTSQ